MRVRGGKKQGSWQRVIISRDLHCLLSALGNLERWGRTAFVSQKEDEQEGGKSRARVYLDKPGKVLSETERGQ